MDIQTGLVQCGFEVGMINPGDRVDFVAQVGLKRRRSIGEKLKVDLVDVGPTGKVVLKGFEADAVNPLS